MSFRKKNLPCFLLFFLFIYFCTFCLCWKKRNLPNWLPCFHPWRQLSLTDAIKTFHRSSPSATQSSIQTKKSLKKVQRTVSNPLIKVNSSNRDKVVPPGGTSITDHGQFPSIPATERRRGSWPSCWGARKALEPVWRRRRRSWSGYRTERHRGKAHYDDLFRSGQHAYSDAEGRRQGLQQG